MMYKISISIVTVDDEQEVKLKCLNRSVQTRPEHSLSHVNV